ncbi:hypothetical protein SPHINGO391_240026 [Sphingomonas aurantiaca]|uniref:Uncharacterized protein n=1 Tax=Sphingomonas aurantiaca TaxID=185949 RepID=A0A5E7XZH5_9SPHN|nr:hypothetical protein SPHINGO391_240026 [Sphingomonas aurantiaca]
MPHAHEYDVSWEVYRIRRAFTFLLD